MSRRVETDLLIRGMLSVHTLPSLGGVADKFLVYDGSSNTVAYRTASEVLSDLGAAPASIGIDQVLGNDNVTSLSLTVGGLAINGAFALPAFSEGFLKVDANGNVISDATQTIDVTDYDYDIVGAKNGSNTIFTLRYPYNPDTTKVYINGVRLTLGAGYDYDERGGNQIEIFTAPEIDDLLIVDYKITIP